MAEYVLPDLDYDYGALEPHISGEIMELHHSKHHATYVKGANDAIEQLAEAREDGSIAAKAPLLSKNLAFHLGGHTNHSVFWKNMSPNGGDKPEGELAAAIDAEFGSFDKFRAQFTAAANGLRQNAVRVAPFGQYIVIAGDVHSTGGTAAGAESADRSGECSA